MMEMITMPPRTGKVFTVRMELEEKIMQTRQEMKKAGPVHRRDLRKHLKRMLAQLADYDRYQAACNAEGGVNG